MPDDKNPAPRRYDRIRVRRPEGGSDVLAREEFEALPLAERVKLLVGGRMHFFAGDEEISPRDALKS